MHEHAKTSSHDPARAARIFWPVAAGLLFWSFGYAVMRGSDLWWHLAAGRSIVASGSLPRVDAWSFTRAGQPWIHHEWLSDVIYDVLSRAFGRDALVLWKWGLVALAFTLLFRLLARRTGDATASILVCLAAAAAAAPFLDIRPHLYTLLGFVLLVPWTLERARPSWAVPWIFLVWANLHGGFFFGLLALGLLLLPRLFFGDRDARLRALGIAGASTALALVNPNGLHAFTYPLKYAFDKTSPFRELGEWLPPFQAGGIRSPVYPWLIGLFVIAALACLVTPALRRERDWLIAGLALGGLTLAMSLQSRRFIPLFAIAQTLVTAPALARLLAPLARVVPALAPPLLVLALALFRLAPYPWGPRAFSYLTVEESFPVDTCDFIEANRLEGKVFAYYNWGGYLHLRSAGRLKVFIDGRADTVFDAATYNRYLKVLNHDPGFVEVIEDSGADFVLWDRRDTGLVRPLVETDRWRELYSDSVSTLLVRRGVSLPAEPVTPSNTAWHELTLGSALLESGKTAEAEEHFARALARPPRPRSACLGLARAQLRGGKRDEAGRTVDSCQRLFPSPELIAALRKLERSLDGAR